MTKKTNQLFQVKRMKMQLRNICKKCRNVEVSGKEKICRSCEMTFYWR